MISFQRGVVTGLMWFSFQIVAATGSAQIPPTGARTVALGGATAGLPGVDGARQNPAALWMEDRASLSLGFNQLFGMPDLEGRSADVAVPVGAAILSVGLSGFGFDVFSETELSAGVAGKVRGLGMGLRARGIQSRFDRYGSVSRLVLDAGWMYAQAPELVFGASIRNVGSGSSGIQIAIGLSAQTGTGLLMVVSTAMSRGTPADVRFGFEMKPVEVLALRLGGSLNPGLVTTGFGLIIGRLMIDVAFSLHARLGLTPVITLRFVK